MIDDYKHKGMRKKLVQVIKEKGISNRSVLKAIGEIPRHFFFDKIFLEHAYQDKAFPIGEGQTISQPYTVAFQTELLNVKHGSKILEIGTGSGYQASVLVALGAEVYTIEYQKKLYEKTKEFLPRAFGYEPHFFYGDGSKGLLQYAPYDGIIVTAGAPTVPSDLIKQLKIGGVLVIPVGNNQKQRMLKITRISENKLSKKEYNHFSFVPLLGANGWNH